MKQVNSQNLKIGDIIITNRISEKNKNVFGKITDIIICGPFCQIMISDFIIKKEIMCFKSDQFYKLFEEEVTFELLKR